MSTFCPDLGGINNYISLSPVCFCRYLWYTRLLYSIVKTSDPVMGTTMESSETEGFSCFVEKSACAFLKHFSWILRFHGQFWASYKKRKLWVTLLRTTLEHSHLWVTDILKKRGTPWNIFIWACLVAYNCSENEKNRGPQIAIGKIQAPGTPGVSHGTKIFVSKFFSYIKI